MPRPKGFEPFTVYFYLEYTWISKLYSAYGQQVGRAKYARSKLYDDADTALREQAGAKAGYVPLGISYDATDITTNLSAVIWYNKRDYVTPFVNDLGKQPKLVQTLPY
jgi:hypothetical protein